MNKNKKINVIKRNHKRCLHLHLGAHKTASTHLQSLFSKIASDFCHPKVHYIGPEVLREITKGSKSNGVDNLKATITELISTEDREILLISDENMLGTLGQFVRTGKFYGEAHRNLSRYSFLSNNFNNITIWLTIRDVKSFKKSAYIELLNWRRQKYAKKFLDVSIDNKNWFELISVIHKVFPSANINILIYEKYHENLQLILNDIFKAEVKLPSGVFQFVKRQKFNPILVNMIIFMDAIYVPLYIRKKILTFIQKFNRKPTKKNNIAGQHLDEHSYRYLGTELTKKLGVNLYGAGWGE